MEEIALAVIERGSVTSRDYSGITPQAYLLDTYLANADGDANTINDNRRSNYMMWTDIANTLKRACGESFDYHFISAAWGAIPSTWGLIDTAIGIGANPLYRCYVDAPRDMAGTYEIRNMRRGDIAGAWLVEDVRAAASALTIIGTSAILFEDGDGYPDPIDSTADIFPDLSANLSKRVILFDGDSAYFESSLTMSSQIAFPPLFKDGSKYLRLMVEYSFTNSN